ncbi:MAG: arsenic efflux protein [Corallococcus sp.]|nr:arsenic efflux protein [Corallococcus sp.]MCM1359116.1 arsenic efflux protein [Corallococcus sp.]MCM1394506.1 arsenic efflux protein [Corallococcus sp.]
MWEILLDALKDSAIALPFLLAIYLIIEFLERNRQAKQRTVRLLNGKLAPLVAGGVGLVPQCGFSVMATDLYCQNYLKTGTLIAFFVATSDEALPILLTNSKTVGTAWVVLLVKIVYAVALGYLINLIDRRVLSKEYVLKEEGCCHHSFSEDKELEQNTENDRQSDRAADSASTDAANDVCDQAHDDVYDGNRKPEHAHTHENHGGGKRFWNFVKHPLLHTLKIFIYVFVVNALFGILLYCAEQAITDFTSQLGFFQCFLTAALGLIPNCASSVIIAGMYTGGIVNFSAMLAGLVSNSGIALAILFKQRGKLKRNFAILGIMYAAGVVLGVICYFFFPLVGLS